GLEQVEEMDAGLSYRAAVVDTRNLDSRALVLLENSGIPLVRTEDAAKLTADQLATFLEGAGVAVDRRTPSQLQLIVGPGHVLVYRRSGDGGRTRVYPRVNAEDAFELRDENGALVFSGTADALATGGIEVDVE